MGWFGRRKDDPPTAKPGAPSPPKGAASEPVLSPGQNILQFPAKARDKILTDAHRAAVHELLDELLDSLGEHDYLVMGIESDEEPLS